MNILHVIRDVSVATGGPVSAVCGLAEAQARRGHEVRILATDFGDGAKAERDGVDIEMSGSRGGSWGYAPEFSHALARRVSQADILHLHMVWDYPVWAAARVAMRYRKPFLLRPCGQLDRWSMSQKRLKKRAYLALFNTQIQGAAAIHFTTAGERDSAHFFTGMKRSFVIPVGVAESSYSDLPAPTAFAERFPELARRRIVLFLGRIHPKKQPETLIDAFAQIADGFERAHLVFAGPADDGYLTTLKSRIRSSGIAERTTFTGPLVGASVTEAHCAAEVFALPSMQENFGISIVEAMAAGRPVLISDRVDLAAEIDEADAGLIRAPNAEAFADGLRKLLGDPTLAKNIAANGRNLVLRNYCWDPIADRILDAYGEVIEGAERRISQTSDAGRIVLR